MRGVRREACDARCAEWYFVLDATVIPFRFGRSLPNQTCFRSVCWACLVVLILLGLIDTDAVHRVAGALPCLGLFQAVAAVVVLVLVLVVEV